MEEPGPAPELSLRCTSRFPEVRLRELRPWLARLLASQGAAGASLGVLFTGDRTIRRLNREYRGKDAATDVLSFHGDETPEGPHLGDLALSVPAARRQAAARGYDARREIRLLLLHGVLHLLGYDHERDEGEMERLERGLRRRWIDG
ncbi:MAG TPA: rRNA maturation RNase YbeY [Thermoanaerobaculia bacterium]|nr:rRNA maturation RNase YbeY [Thermoanaerobaculia bacterium]